MFENLKATSNQFPRTYWVVAGTHFIDVIGNTLLMPFFALYVTQKFGVGLTQAGIMLATNSVAGMIGFTMYGFVATIPLFIVAMVMITISEMIGMPTSNVLAASFAPEEMRARYMAVFGLTWTVPSMIGSWAAGLVFDNYNPNFVWYIGGVLCVIAMMAFYFLHIKLGGKETFKRVEAQAAAD